MTFRYVKKGPSKSPLKSYFSFCACDFCGDHIRWKISANTALTCEEGRESVGNCGSFSGEVRNFTRIFLTCDQALFFSRRCSQRKNERLIQLLVESSVKSPESGLFSDWSGNKRQFAQLFAHFVPASRLC